MTLSVSTQLYKRVHVNYGQLRSNSGFSQFIKSYHRIWWGEDKQDIFKVTLNYTFDLHWVGYFPVLVGGLPF